MASRARRAKEKHALPQEDPKQILVTSELTAALEQQPVDLPKLRKLSSVVGLPSDEVLLDASAWWHVLVLPEC